MGEATTRNYPESKNLDLIKKSILVNNLKQLERLRKTHKLIKLENTGTPGELAQKLHISARQTYLVLEQLREMDAPLHFNRKTRTYYYKHAYELTINISIQVLARDKLMNIYAGSSVSNYIESLQGSCSKPNYLSYIKSKLDLVG